MCNQHSNVCIFVSVNYKIISDKFNYILTSTSRQSNLHELMITWALEMNSRFSGKFSARIFSS